jgi:serine/threonine protein kinase
MELVDGQALAEHVREGPLSIEEARRYGSEIADALAHAHERGVTHRDLKGTNVVITPRRGAKVLDFGLARRLDMQQIDALSDGEQIVRSLQQHPGLRAAGAGRIRPGDRGVSGGGGGRAE